MSDVLKLLKSDHDKVEKLFKDYEETTDRAIKTRRRLVDDMIEELSVHAAVEEQVLYPVARELSDDAADQALESLEEHHVVKVLLAELEKIGPENERFHPKVTVLMENVRHHVTEEEEELFPMMRKALDTDTLDGMADAIETARETAPTHPHPTAPDEPPANLVIGAVAGLVDRIRDKLPV